MHENRADVGIRPYIVHLLKQMILYFVGDDAHFVPNSTFRNYLLFYRLINLTALTTSITNSGISANPSPSR